MDKHDALFFFGVILAWCGAILAAPLQLQGGGNNPGIVLLFAGIVVMIVGIAPTFSRKS